MKRIAALCFVITISTMAYAGLDEGQAAFDKKNYKTALKEWQPLASQGNVYAQRMLGIIYDLGLGGVIPDGEQAFAWYLKAAKQGDRFAQTKVGSAYQHGDGVAKDDKQAVFWYRKAAEQGSAAAQDNLNLMQSLAAAEQCTKNATTKLFDTAIRCTIRYDFRKAVKSAGNTVVREDQDYWIDQYKSGAVLEGSDVFEVGYTASGQFAYAEYTSPANMDTGKVVTVKDMIASKYGKPQKSNGDPALGEMEYMWKMKAGIEIFVSRGWPDTTVHLTYREPKNFAVMRDEIKKAQSASQQETHNKQSHAF